MSAGDYRALGMVLRRTGHNWDEAETIISLLWGKQLGVTDEVAIEQAYVGFHHED